MMIFLRILSSILGLIVILASLYMIEAASYRLVEPYAKFRLNLSWGDYLDSEINPYLSKLPLDHFLQPVSSSHLLTSNEVLKRELDYSKKILGVTTKPISFEVFEVLLTVVDLLITGVFDNFSTDLSIRISFFSSFFCLKFSKCLIHF